MKLTLYVEPTPKARPRIGTSRKTGKKYAYTPKPTVHAENLIRDRVMETDQSFEAGTPIKLVATFFRVKPKSTPKRVLLPVTKPDWDNMGKLLGDALEHFVYYSDSQITTALIKKRFGSPPRIELEMSVDVP